jgi:hypothetical protein
MQKKNEVIGALGWNTPWIIHQCANKKFGSFRNIHILHDMEMTYCHVPLFDSECVSIALEL